MAQRLKCLPGMQETRVQSLGQEDALEKEMATHSSTLAWKIPRDYLGAKLSHACVIRRCHELLGDERIHQFCIRSGEKAEFLFAREHTDMHKFGFHGLMELVKELRENNTPVYLTIDLDCLDPSVFPGTGTPEAGGVSFMQLLDAIRLVAETNVIGADVNELAPMLDASGVSTATA